MGLWQFSLFHAAGFVKKDLSGSDCNSPVIYSCSFALQPSLLAFPIAIPLFDGLTVFLFFRYGLLALIAFIQILYIWLIFSIGASLSIWYSKTGLKGLALLLAFALYAFYSSPGGRPLFGTPRLDK